MSESVIVNDPLTPSGCSTDPLTRELRMMRPDAWTVRSQSTVLESMIVFAVVIVHGPVYAARVQVGPVLLGGQKAGTLRPLTRDEVAGLHKLAEAGP